MVVDTSALVAMVQGEPERALFAERLAEQTPNFMTAVSWTEVRMVVLSRMRRAGLAALQDLMAAASIEVLPVSVELADSAFDAFRRFGKGRHPARLNLGDCFSYALAKQMSVPLLFKGDDFSKTDVLAATAAR
jgi:ribonuclease VapC